MKMTVRASLRSSTTLFVLLVLPAAAFADTTSTLTLPSGVEVEITEAPFIRKLFRISGCTENGTHCVINGHVPFGVTGRLPKTYVKRISISYKGRSYTLDARDMYDAWGGRPLEVKGVIRYFGGKCFEQRNCRLRGIFSDASGTFVAEWDVVDGKSMRSLLTGDDDIVALFKEKIDPPEYD